MPSRSYWVYIVASQTRVLYIGVTNDIVRRVSDHRSGAFPRFASKYRCRHLVHLEQTGDVNAAIAREKQLKGWRRSKKLALTESGNREWNDQWNSVDILLMRG